MTGRFPPLLIAFASAALLSGVGLVVMAGALRSHDQVGARAPSLLELLEQVAHPDGRGRLDRPAPPPPSPRRWASPLKASCPAIDPALRRRLTAQLNALEQRTVRVAIDPSNYGQRFERDVYGNRLDPTPQLIVLHETVYGLSSAINTFRTPHPQDEDQVSYHTLIGQQGTVVEALDPRLRAFGAGWSAFNGRWVITNPKVGGSVNNFSLHLSLETPIDGEDSEATHSGYTPAQYDAMATVLASWMHQFRIPPEKITTHRHIDLGDERADPRSFNWSELQKRLVALGFSC